MERRAKPRYSEGSKVKIKTGGWLTYPSLKGYEDMVGVVTSAKAVIAYVSHTRFVAVSDSHETTMYVYSVELSQGVTLYDLMEYCLELAQTA